MATSKTIPDSACFGLLRKRFTNFNFIRKVQEIKTIEKKLFGAIKLSKWRKVFLKNTNILYISVS